MAKHESKLSPLEALNQRHSTSFSTWGEVSHSIIIQEAGRRAMKGVADLYVNEEERKIAKKAIKGAVEQTRRAMETGEITPDEASVLYRDTLPSALHARFDRERRRLLTLQREKQSSASPSPAVGEIGGEAPLTISQPQERKGFGGWFGNRVKQVKGLFGRKQDSSPLSPARESSVSEEPTSPKRSWMRRHPVASAMGGLAAVALVGGIALHQRHENNSATPVRITSLRSSPPDVAPTQVPLASSARAETTPAIESSASSAVPPKTDFTPITPPQQGNLSSSTEKAEPAQPEVVEKTIVSREREGGWQLVTRAYGLDLQNATPEQIDEAKALTMEFIRKNRDVLSQNIHNQMTLRTIDVVTRGENRPYTAADFVAVASILDTSNWVIYIAPNAEYKV